MQAEIIAIGDEILIGQIIDSNSGWMGMEFGKAGVRVDRVLNIGDDEQQIVAACAEALERSQVVVLTGGLGPTNDDKTSASLCKLFKCGLRRDVDTLEHITRYFEGRGRAMTDLNRAQADVPEVCEILHNPHGTAPGLWFDYKGRVLVALPGVPYEMKHLFETHVLPRLKERFELPARYHKTVLTQGVGESFLADIIKDWEDALPAHIGLAYLPSPGLVRLRISAQGAQLPALEQDVETQIASLLPLIEKYVFGFNTDTLAGVLGLALSERGKTMAVAESCTGGNIAHLLTLTPGSSAYFTGGLVTYSYESKEELLGVPHEVITDKGAVSREVVEHMVRGVRERFNSDYGVAVSGIAGPDGGTPDKPVGTVWMAVASAQAVHSKVFMFGKNRERNITQASLAALDMVLRMVREEVQQPKKQRIE